MDYFSKEDINYLKKTITEVEKMIKKEAPFQKTEISEKYTKEITFFEQENVSKEAFSEVIAEIREDLRPL